MIKIDSITNQIDELFKHKNLYGGVTHSYFYECLVKGQLSKFYIDSRVKFNGKRQLVSLINQLKEMKSKH